MNVINVRKQNLVQQGYTDFTDWSIKPNHVYIGRNMSVYIKGAVASKWQNKFTVKKYGLTKCLEMYEQHIRNSELYDQLDELVGKELGCWCKPNSCHGDVLIKLLNEKKIIN